MIDRIVEGTQLQIAIAVLIHRSAWFEVRPLPDDLWRVSFGRDNGHEKAIDNAILGVW